MAALFGATSSFRLVTAPAGDDGRAEVVLAAERIAASLGGPKCGQRIILDPAVIGSGDT